MNATNTIQSTLKPNASGQLEEMGRQLAGLPPDVLERVHYSLTHGTIHEAASLLYKAGLCFASSELYEYRSTLFPLDAMVDPYTQGPPLLAEHESAEHPLPSPTENVRLATEERPSPDVPFPQPVIHPTNNQSALLTDLRDLLRRYVVLPEMGAEALALWVVHTYAFTLREVTTYIGVVSPEKRCGKTTLLELLGALAHQPVAAANISPSALFRTIEEVRPTLIIDEVDTFLHGRDEIAGILNAGYRKANSYVVRVANEPERARSRSADCQSAPPHVGDLQPPHESRLVRFSCWCPKVMAAIGRLPDTLADRCILINMQRKMRAEKCDRLRELDATKYQQRCAEFVHTHRQAIAGARPKIPVSLNDRAADIWEPLFAIADLAGGPWPKLARQAARKLSADVDDDITFLGCFLQDIRNWIVDQRLDCIFSRDLVEALNSVHDRPWEDLRRGREINEYWLAARMRELGIRSRYLRLGQIVARGYLLADIEVAFHRYVPQHSDQGSTGDPSAP